MTRRFEIQTKLGPDGRRRIYVPFMTASDIHFATRQCSAKRISHAFEHILADKLYLIGDIVDGERLIRKDRWKFGPEDPQANWHREGIAHILRMAANGCDVTDVIGNHDEAIREKETVYRGQEQILPNGKIIRPGESYKHHNLCGKSLFGVKFAERDYFADPVSGFRFLITHGDKYDEAAFGKDRGFWYDIGDRAENFMVLVDQLGWRGAAREVFAAWRGAVEKTIKQRLDEYDDAHQQDPEREEAARAKKLVKWIIYNWMGVRAELCKTLDADARADGLIFGHLHSQFIDATNRWGGVRGYIMRAFTGRRLKSGGKAILNDGCGTEHDPQFLWGDGKGMVALVKWRDDGIEIVAEFDSVERRISRKKRFQSWESFGLDDFKAEPLHIQDRHKEEADTVIRLSYRKWRSPQERASYRAEHPAATAASTPIANRHYPKEDALAAA